MNGSRKLSRPVGPQQPLAGIPASNTHPSGRSGPADWLMDNSDDERLGKAGVKDSAESKKLVEAVTYFNAWLKHANGKWQGGEQ